VGAVYVPYTGIRQAFDTRPNRMPGNLVEGSVTSQEVILSVVVDPNTSPPVVEQRLLAQEQDLVQWSLSRDGLARESAAVAPLAGLLWLTNGLRPVSCLPVRMWLKRGLRCRKLHCPPRQVDPVARR
jgi:hypothetical protein